MTKYVVTLKIKFEVDINDQNVQADPRPPLQGDTPKTAINRALLCYLNGSRSSKELKRKLGIGRTYTLKRDWEALRITEDEPQQPVESP